MQCRHCLEHYTETMKGVELGLDNDGRWLMHYVKCPACKRFNIDLTRHSVAGKGQYTVPTTTDIRVYPASGIRRAPVEVPEEFATDFREASLVIDNSPKASAALSRRCLQHIIREKLGIKDKDLAPAIDKAIKQLPPYLADQVDAIRQVGNFAAHPIKSQSTGEIVEVEPGEAEWLLDVLEGLFQHCFVGPAEAERRRARLNEKLTDAGRTPLKVSSQTSDNTEDNT